MFNPQPRVEMLAIEPGLACCVIDDALREPARWVELAAEHARGFRDSPGNAFPGPEMPLPDAATAALAAFVATHLGDRLDVRGRLRCTSRLSLVARAPRDLEPRQSIPHVDRIGATAGERILASVLYLFADPALGGTSFYRPRRPLPELADLVQDSARLDAAAFEQRHGIAPGYPEASAWFEKVLTVPARFNRLIVYPGTVFHAGEISAPDRLSCDPRVGRLTWNGFFVCPAQRTPRRADTPASRAHRDG